MADVAIEERAENGEELRKALRFVDDKAGMLRQNQQRIGLHAIEGHGILEIDGVVLRERQPSQCRLADLASPHYRDGRELTGDGEQPSLGNAPSGHRWWKYRA